VCVSLFTLWRLLLPFPGDVVWNGMPFSYYVELADPALFEYALTIRTMLNSQFNKTHGVLCGKHTDVPGVADRPSFALFSPV
jgi:hypothetical protein